MANPWPGSGAARVSPRETRARLLAFFSSDTRSRDPAKRRFNPVVSSTLNRPERTSSQLRPFKNARLGE